MTYALLLLFLLAAVAARAATGDERPVLRLQGQAAELVVDLGGGSIADFHLGADGLNPLSWDSWSFSQTPDADPPVEPRSMGHFLCLDRWGQASQAETAHGMGWHGEASRVWWEVSSPAAREGGFVRAEMQTDLPMAGLRVQRSLRLSTERAFFVVDEAVTNYRPLGRIYNMVQHPTIGPPFLDEHTLVDANGTRGFMQASPMPHPEEPAVDWPQALKKDGTTVDMRRLKGDAEPNVVSYIVEDEHGWVAAASPTTGLLLGYIWEREDYPWFDAWRHVSDGKPFARGLEFGTTGLHQPFPVLVEKLQIFGRPLFVHIDADQTQTRSFACFLMEIPKDFAGVEKLVYAQGRIELQERGAQGRKLSMEVGELFAP